jgi:hypothetical protein
VVELGEAPVDEAQLPVLVVDHDVVRLDVAVHDAHAVAIVERLQKLVQVETDVVVGQGLEKTGQKTEVPAMSYKMPEGSYLK